MKEYRNERIASLITQKLNEIFQREFDFNGALVTIKNVEIDKELKEAKIKIAVIPSELEIYVFQEIDKEKKNLQRKLLKKLFIRSIPNLKFLIEKHLEE